MVELWVRVTNAGGAVGFVAPTTSDEVAPTAAVELDRVRDGRDDLVVAFDGDTLVGFGFLVTSDSPASAHVGLVRRLQRDPEARGRGIGAAVLAELEAAGSDRGLELLTLTVRGGTGYERFYEAHGWHVDARLPGRLRGPDGRERDVVCLSKPSAIGHEAAPTVPLPVRQLDPGLPLPSYARAGDAGLDLHAAEGTEVPPGGRAVVPTGVAVAVPDGYVGLVHPRSGLAARHGLTIVNAPGTIDAGYRGEILVVVANLDAGEAVRLTRGDRIAQLVVQPVARADVVAVDELPDHQGPGAHRGERGFGSTGR